ncbi:hypothetical protein BGZ94_004356 [Podila epigama]|nr:hypothetical protein BGZ94_004356 [Podila epigama]
MAHSDDQSVIDAGGPSSSKSKDSKKQASKRTLEERFQKHHWEYVLSWLEHDPNFNSIFGVSGQTFIGLPTKIKTHGFATLAAALSKYSKGKISLNGKNMCERFGRYLSNYYKATHTMKSTGFGVTDADNRKGIYTIPQKMEKPLAEVSMAFVEGSAPPTQPQHRRRLIQEEVEDGNVAEAGKEEESPVREVHAGTQDVADLSDNDGELAYEDDVDNFFDNDENHSQVVTERDTSVDDNDA